MGWHQILSLLFFLLSPLPFASPIVILPPMRPCPHAQRDSLLQFKNSFMLDIYPSSSCNFHDAITYHPNNYSWDSDDCCMWDGVLCHGVTGNVISLDLTCLLLRDNLHSNSSLLLPKLEHLRLLSCNLTKFPYFLNSLKSLTYLDLSFNGISGEIPRWFWAISHDTLEILDLSNNLIEGGIQQLQWKRLLRLGLQNNRFIGEIPSSICQLNSLAILDFSNNSLFGSLPPCLGNMTKLMFLELANNKFQGSLPRSLVKCMELSSLILNHNELNDIFPHWLEALHLKNLDLRSNKFHGRINFTVFGLSFSSLDTLLISNNNFTGQWPTQVFSNISLTMLDLSNNKFGGPIPLPSPIIYYYNIAGNYITGKIPSLICNATMLHIIDFSNNYLIGSLPRCLTNFSTNLSILNLGLNKIEGSIPRSFSSNNSLTTLNLSQNKFEGTLPRSLVKCKYLEVLDLSDNHIEDTFPRWLGTLPELKVLILRSNNFKGLFNIPKGALLFPKLRILDLSRNNFGGSLPTNLIMNLEGMINREDGQDKSLYMTRPISISMSYENSVTVVIKGLQIKLEKILTIFTTIDLSQNSFQGEIPKVIGNLHSLIGLNLSHNHLTGSIPLTLGNLTNLEWLDLSLNKLTEGIPRVLGDLAFLGYLNLSNNQLTGPIPQDKQLSTFSNDSFGGNPYLCGTPLSKACPGSTPPPSPTASSTFDHENYESWFKQKTVWIGYASGIIIGISIAYITFEMRRPKWLVQGVRMLERRVAKRMERKRQKVIKFHGQ